MAVSRILIECGAAQTRAAYIVGDDAVRFWFNPARGDEALPRPPMTGDLYVGRVRSVAKGLGAFVDIGAGPDGFSPLKKADAPPVEGALSIFRVCRPPLGEKGAVLSPDCLDGFHADQRQALEREARERGKPGPLGAPEDAAIHAFRFVVPDIGVDGQQNVLTNDPTTARVLREYGVRSVAMHPGPFEELGAGAALDAALDRRVVLPGGARLIIDETEGLAVIDVDAGTMAGAAGARLNDKVNLAGAAAIPAELSRRAIGGRVVIDFLPPSGAPARAALVEALRRSLRGLIGARLGKLSADGLFDLTIPRRRLSLLEEATECAGDGWARAGRRLTLDWSAKAAIGALERALSRQPSLRPRLVVGTAIDAYLRDARPQWLERVAALRGARFSVLADPARDERSFDLAE